MTDHTIRQFDTDIERMRSTVSMMGGLVERQFVRAIDAVRDGDLQRVTQVLEDERAALEVLAEAGMAPRLRLVPIRRNPGSPLAG
jgi:hypothetical protein